MSLDIREYSVTETAIGRGQGRAIRTAGYKCVIYTGADGEAFYDLKKDPGETRNLVDEPKLADELRRHRQLLRQWCRKTNDRFAVPE